MTALTALSQVALTKQAQNGGYTYGDTTLPPSFEGTANGHASGYTVESSSFGTYASNDSDIAGGVVEVKNATNGPAGEKGYPLRRRCVAFSFSTTLTIEALPFQASSDSFGWIDDPGAWFCEDTGGSVTVIDDATRSERAADAYNGAAEMGGPYAVPLIAANISDGLYLVSDDDGAGAITVATMDGSTAIGDLFELMQFPEVVGSPLELKHPRLDRTSMTGKLGLPRGAAGLQEVSGNWEMMDRGPGSSRIGDPAEIDTALGSVTTVTAAPADETIAAGTTTTSVNVGSAVTAGEMYLTESGDVCVATTSADPFTPSPTLRYDPADGTTLYGMRTYGPAEAAQYYLKAWQWYARDVLEELPGLLPTVQWAGQMDQHGKWTLGLRGAGGKRTYLDSTNTAYSRAAALDAKTSTILPRRLGETRIVLDGLELEARSFSVDLGLMIELETNLKLPDRRNAVLRKDAPTFTIDLFLDTDAKATAVKAIEGRGMTLLIQSGTVPGDPGVTAFWAKEVEITDIAFGDDTGAITATIQGRVTYDDTSDLSRWLIGKC